MGDEYSREFTRMLMFAKGGGNTLHQIRTNHVTQTGCARHQTVPEGAALPIVSHSPGPEGDSCRQLPPRLGGDNTRQADESQSPHGWAGGQTNKGRHYLNPGSGCGWRWEGGGSNMHGLRNPRDPPNTTRWSNTTCHRHPPCSPPQLPSCTPSSPDSPTRGWVGGRTENCLKVKRQTIV